MVPRIKFTIDNNGREHVVEINNWSGEAAKLFYSLGKGFAMEDSLMEETSKLRKRCEEYEEILNPGTKQRNEETALDNEIRFMKQ